MNSVKNLSVDNLEDVKETLMFPLISRYVETKNENGAISDLKSVQILDSIDYDISRTKLYEISRLGVCLRTIIFDEEVNKFLEKNPDGVIVNLGCGLDTRFTRIDNGRVRWFELDFPETIELRRHFFEETERYSFISGSVLDKKWVNGIPKGKKIMFIAEGLCFYLSEDENKELLGIIKDNFPGSELLMEALHPLFVKVVDKKKYDDPLDNKTAELLQWGVKSGIELGEWFDEIEFIKERFVIKQDQKRFPLLMRILFRLFPVLTRSNKVMHFKFN